MNHKQLASLILLTMAAATANASEYVVLIKDKNGTRQTTAGLSDATKPNQQLLPEFQQTEVGQSSCALVTQAAVSAESDSGVQLGLKWNDVDVVDPRAGRCKSSGLYGFNSEISIRRGERLTIVNNGVQTIDLLRK